MQKNVEIFGSYENNVYLCKVKMNVLTIRVEFRVGAGPYRHRPVLKSCFGGSLFIIPFYKGFEEVTALDRSSFQKY